MSYWPALAICFFLVSGCEIFSESGPGETDLFLVVLKNNTFVPVSIGTTQPGIGGTVQALDEQEITLSGDEGDVFGFFTATAPLVPADSVQCTLHLPRAKSPARQVDWSGNDLRCFFW